MICLHNYIHKLRRKYIIIIDITSNFVRCLKFAEWTSLFQTWFQNKHHRCSSQNTKPMTSEQATSTSVTSTVMISAQTTSTVMASTPITSTPKTSPPKPSPSTTPTQTTSTLEPTAPMTSTPRCSAPIQKHKLTSHMEDSNALSLIPHQSCLPIMKTDKEQLGTVASNLTSYGQTNVTGCLERSGASSLHATIKPYPPAPHYSDLMSVYTPLHIPAVTPHDYVYIPIIHPHDGGCYHQPVPRDRVLPLSSPSLPDPTFPSVPGASYPRVASLPAPSSVSPFLPHSLHIPSSDLISEQDFIHSSLSSGYSSRSPCSDVIIS